MTRHLEAGVPAGEAARLVREGIGPAEPAAQEAPVKALSSELGRALDEFDDAGAQSALDKIVATLSFETAAGEVILPYLRELGERWERGDASVAQEHFASLVIRGRLLSLARGWDRGAGPRALLACAPGEQHDLGLIVFGLALRQHGWRITQLGADTPLDTIAAAVDALRPDAVVLVALTAGRMDPVRAELSNLAAQAPLFLAGAGAGPALAAEVGARMLGGDPIDAAAELAAA
jgi:methanogenic corrinoid protein MtbC1